MDLPLYFSRTYFSIWRWLDAEDFKDCLV